MKVRPFAALRPPKSMVEEVSSPPYDVLNSAEAKELAGEKSLLHITRPEIDFEPMAGEHDAKSYDKAVENFALWQERGWLVRDSKPCYYIYAQRMGERTQYGFVLCAHSQDYVEGRIKKHELTRKDKEDDRMHHVEIQRANIEPVFFSFKPVDGLARIISDVTAGTPEYDFIDENGFGHIFWHITDDAVIEKITWLFESEVESFYIADGHHRSAAAARVGADMADRNPSHTGEEEYNYFMAVCFPEDQLRVMDYNRVLKDLNGHTPEELLAALDKDFIVKDNGETLCAPDHLHSFALYLGGHWYSMEAREGTYDDGDPIAVLDVNILTERVLKPIFGIGDLRTDKRIDFVGGIRGLGELKRLVDGGQAAAAFALYPVSMKQITDIADIGAIMPPKTTWFEPKLRSGLAIHTF